MKEREIRVTLHDGSEVIMNTEERILFRAPFAGATPITVDAEHIVDDLILTLERREIALYTRRSYDTTVCELHEELEQKNATIKELEREHDYAKRQAIEWNEKAVALKEENARLRKALEEAKAEYSKEGTDIQVLRRMIKIIDGVLGEGDGK